MKGIDIAVKYLNKKNLTCAIVSNSKIVYESYERGVTPLIRFIDLNKKNKYKQPVLADKVIGKAAALLCVYGGITEINTKVISKDAKDILKKYNILFEFNQEVNHIENRDKTGLCPMEKLSADVNEPEKMYKLVVKWLDARAS